MPNSKRPVSDESMNDAERSPVGIVGTEDILSKLPLYIVFGCTAFIADYCVFLLVHQATGNPYLGNVFGVCVGMAISFTLDQKFNFRRQDAVLHRAMKFVAVDLCGMALSTAIIFVLVEWGVEPRVAKLMAMVVVVAFQFTTNSLWTFARARG